MRKKGLASLYRAALKTSQAELERRSAMEALRQFDNLGLTLGDFLADLKKDWKTFSQLPLADVLEALGARPGRSRQPAAQKPAKHRASAAARGGKRTPKRLTKAVSAKYSEAITGYLADNPGAKTPAIAAAAGLTSKQAAALLKKLRAARAVSAKGKAAGMRYTLKTSGAKKAAKAKKPVRRKKTTKKNVVKKRTRK